MSVRYRTTVTPSLGDLAHDLGAMPEKIRRGLRSGFAAAGRDTLATARSNAASWSTRIPDAISLRTSTTAKSAGVVVRVDSAKAPHARPYEGISGNRRAVRHPLFGDREHWYETAVRPFIAPAIRATREAYMDAARAAIDDAAAALGSRRS